MEPPVTITVSTLCQTRSEARLNAAAVAAVLPYRSSRTRRPPADEAGMEKWGEEYERYLAAQNSNESFLLKPQRYARQAEYRLVWFAAGLEKNYIDIKCPEAIKFCEKVTFGEHSR